MDKIKIQNLEIFANHGVFLEETKLGQKFLVSAVLYTDTKAAGMTDDLTKSIHYGEVSHFITDFMKGCLELETLLTPQELLEELHRIEQEAGRERKIHWGPRTLDLDILFYDKELIETEDLIIPHVDLENRYFVLKPLAEIAPNFRHPILKKTVTQMLEAVKEEA